MDTYKRIQAITSIGERRKAIKALSESQKKDYTNYQSNLRKKKFLKDANNRDKVYAENKEYKAQIRKKNPEKVKAIVREYVRKFRERQAAKNSKALRPLDITDLMSRARIL
jgi:hypothetical protein